MNVGQLFAVFSLSDQLSAPLRTMANNAQQAFDSFSASSAKVGTAISATNRVIQQFSGMDIATKANEYAVAIERVQGVANLTAKEQAQVNAVMTDFIAKANAMGASVPPEFQKIADATEHANSSMGALGEATNKVRDLLGAIGVGLSVGGLIELSKNALASAEQIEFLSDRVGVSAETIQEWKYVAEQTGTTIETFTNAVGFMNKTLAAGTTQTQQILGDLGLDLKTLKSEAPDEAFNAIAAAIARVPNPMLQAEDAVKLFGRTGQELLPAIRDGIEGIAADAPKMSDAMVEGLAKARREQTQFEDENARVISGLTLMGVEIINLQRDLDDLASVDPSKVLGYLVAIATAGSPMLPKVPVGPTEFANSGSLKPITADFDALEASLKTFGNTVGDAAKPVQTLIDKLGGADTREQLDSLSIAVRDVGGAAKVSADQMPALAKELEAWQTAGYKLTPVLQAVVDRGKDMAETSKAAADLAQHWDDVAKSIEAAAGVDTSRQISVLVDAVNSLGGANALTADETAYFDEKIKGLKVSLSALPQVLQDVRGNTFSIAADIAAMNAEWTKVESNSSLAKMFPGAAEGAKQLKESMKGMFPKQDALDWDKALGQVASDFRALASVTSGTMSLVASDIEKGISAAKTFGDSIDLLGQGPGSKDAKGNIIGGAAGVANIIGGVTGIVGAVVGLGETIANVLGIGSTAGRDLIVQFAQSKGGFDQLHSALDATGVSGEMMWQRLSGVGQGDADAANAAIQQATDYLDNLDQATQNVVKAATETQANALTDLNNDISKYKVTIQQLGPAWKQQNLTLEAQDLIGSYTRLTGAGVSVADTIKDMSGVVEDANGTITGFSGGLDQLLNDAIATGAALPDQFKPILQALVDSGNAVDATGHKITSLAGVNFSATLDEQFQTLIESIQKLIDKLTGGLLPALNAVNNTPVAPQVGGVDNGIVDKGGAGSGQGADLGGGGTDANGIPIADIPLSSVERSGYVWVRAGYDVVGGAPTGGQGVGASLTPLANAPGGPDGARISFGDIHVHANDAAGGRAAAESFVDQIRNSGRLASLLATPITTVQRQQGLL